MPQHKSAKKRMKTNAKSEARNRGQRRTLKTAVKNIREMPQEEAMPKLQGALDKAVGKGLLHKNKAARLKSRFARRSTKA